MPNYGMDGVNGSMRSIIVSMDRVFAEGPSPGFVNDWFVMNFFNFVYQGNPNVIATTGNPHWTVHPIWVRQDAAGFVVNRKSVSPGGRQFNVYAMAIGYAAWVKEEKGLEPKAEIVKVSEEEFAQLTKEASKNQ